KLGLKGLRVLRQTAGPNSRVDKPFDFVLERALAPLPQAMELAHPLLVEGGYFIAYQSDEISEPAKSDAMNSRLAWRKSVKYTLPGEIRERRLVVFQKANC